MHIILFLHSCLRKYVFMPYAFDFPGDCVLHQQMHIRRKGLSPRLAGLCLQSRKWGIPPIWYCIKLNVLTFPRNIVIRQTEITQNSGDHANFAFGVSNYPFRVVPILLMYNLIISQTRFTSCNLKSLKLLLVAEHRSLISYFRSDNSRP